LSKQIRSLEEYFGSELFKRSAAGVELTEEGRLLRERIAPLLHEFESLKTDLLNVSRISALRVGTLPSLAAHYLPSRLTELRRQGVQVEMSVCSTSAEIVGLLHSGAADLGLVQSTTPIPRGYWTYELFREPFFAVVPAGHPLAAKPSVAFADLKEEPLVVHPRQCDIRRTIVDVYRAEGYEPKLVMELAFGESIPGFVAAGAGVAILPQLIAVQARSLGVQALPIGGFAADRSISLVSPKAVLGRKLRRYFV
jgi:DNA-binding transcriptional LysR family regulator